MDYRKAYLQIVYRAKSRGIPEGYYEEHHILPSSLGGPDHRDNLAPLTAREHFICHWLLVKMFKKGTIERRKMMYAFWRMRGHPTEDKNRYINSRAYEKLRTEFAKYVSESMKLIQKGNKNSQYGTRWYTNRINGECKKFKILPSDNWVLGRNLFRGENSILFNKDKIDAFNRARRLWDCFHSGNYNSIREFSKLENIPIHTDIVRTFKKYIPKYKEYSYNPFGFRSDKTLIGIYY